MVAILMTSIALALYPITYYIWLFYLLNALQTPFKAVKNLPFIPDLIMEES